MPRSEQIQVNPETERDLNEIIDMKRRGQLLHRPVPFVEPGRKTPPTKYTKVVCLTGVGFLEGRPLHGIVMQRSEKPVQELIMSGAVPDSTQATFELQIEGRTSGVLSVDMPFDALPDEFHSLCQFPASVSVTLGAVEGGSNTNNPNERFPLYRWRIEYRGDDPEAGVLRAQQSDWAALQSYQVVDESYVATDETLNCYVGVPAILPPVRQLIASDRTLEWVSDHWQLVASPPPESGEVVTLQWVGNPADPTVGGEWRRLSPQQYLFGVRLSDRLHLNAAGSLIRPDYFDPEPPPGATVSEELVPQDVYNPPWVAPSPQTVPPTVAPAILAGQRAHTLALVYYDGQWNDLELLRTGFRYGLYQWPNGYYYGGYGGYGYNYGSYGGYFDRGHGNGLFFRADDATYQVYGLIVVVSWTGREWVIVEYERRPRLFTIESEPGY